MNKKRLVWFGFVAGLILTISSLMITITEEYRSFIDSCSFNPQLSLFIFSLFILPGILTSVFSLLKKLKFLYFLGLFDLFVGMMNYGYYAEKGKIFGKIFGFMILTISLLVFFIPLIDKTMVDNNK